MRTPDVILEIRETPDSVVIDNVNVAVRPRVVAVGPPGQAGGVFSVNGETDNVVLTQDDVLDGSTYKQYSQTEKTKLAGIEAGADVTDAANVNAAGATMNSDTTLAGNGYFLDEDTMASNSASKVPSQQSVKAYTDNRLYEKSDRKFYPQLRGWNTAVARRSSTLSRVVVLGDSIMQLFCAGLSAKINTQYNSRADSRYKALSTYDTWTTWTGTKETTHGLGNFGGTLSGSNEGTLTDTCDGFVVLYDVQQTGGADLNIYIDGVLQTTINTTDAGISGTTESGRVWTSSAFTYGSHTLRVTRSGTGTVMLSGAFYTNGNRSTGIQVYNAGHSGYDTTNFTSSTYEAINNLDPQLVIIMLGTNDYDNPAADLETNLTTVVDNIKTDSPLVSILLVAPYEAADRTSWADYVQAVKNVAIAEDVAYLDLYEAMGGLGATADVLGLSDDNVHPNSTGAELMTNAIADAIHYAGIHSSSPSLKADGSVPIIGSLFLDLGNNGKLGFGSLFGFPVYSSSYDTDDAASDWWILSGPVAAAIFSFPSITLGWGNRTNNPDVNIARSAAGELTFYGSTGATYGNIVTGLIRKNAGTPESAVTAPVGAICQDTTNGLLYVKASGTGNTGWVKLSTISSTDTLTNKRVTPRVTTITSSATPTINTDNCDAVTITALATAITSMTTNLTGTPSNFDELIIRIKDDGTARAITWGSKFEAKGVALPTTTVISKVLTVAFIYDTVTAKWGCVGSAQEA
jgi:lysophospholipase L1-like esterase